MSETGLPQSARDRVTRLEERVANQIANQSLWMANTDKWRIENDERQNLRHVENQGLLKDIQAQTRETNGRVSKLEAWKAELTGFAKGSKWVAGLAGAATLAIIEHYLLPLFLGHKP